MPKPRPMPSRAALLACLNDCGSQVKASAIYGISRDLMTTWCRMRWISRSDYSITRKRQPNDKFPGKSHVLATMEKLRTNKAIAGHYGIHRQTLLRWYKRMGVKGPGRDRLTPEDIPLIRELQQYMSVNYIADKFEVSPRTIRDVLSFTTWSDIK